MALTIRGDEASLDPKLEAVLAELCRRLGRPLFKTQAVKLPYLVDVVATHVLGKPITEGTHETWEHGVVTREVYRFITYPPDDTAPFKIQPHEFSESGAQISLRSSEAPMLTKSEREVVDYVADTYGDLPTERLGLITKALNSELAPEDWGSKSNRRALVNEEAYARLAPGWLKLYERLPELDLMDRSLWGEAIEDPAQHLREALGIAK
jgi:uncharacterized phage-associated protein